MTRPVSDFSSFLGPSSRTQTSTNNQRNHAPAPAPSNSHPPGFNRNGNKPHAQQLRPVSELFPGNANIYKSPEAEAIDRLFEVIHPIERLIY
jgi:hypothetical protein